MDRRAFVTTSLGSLLAARVHAQAQSALNVSNLPGLWDIDRSVANLENAYWGVMPRIVNDDYLEQARFLNSRNVVFVRDGIAGRERTAAIEQVRKTVADLMGASAAEFALTRNDGEGRPRTTAELPRDDTTQDGRSRLPEDRRSVKQPCREQRV